jgi:adenylate cyclase class 2
MAKEIEAKFSIMNKDEIAAKLIGLGAKKVFDERLLRRAVYDFPISRRDAWARVRDEVDQITMSYKCVNSLSLDGVEEVELIINDFEKGRAFLKSLGMIEKAYQETKRMRYVVENGAVEFDIDTWPGLTPWVEIEAKSEEKVKQYAALLGFNWSDAMFGSADYVYAKVYNITADWINNNCPILSFEKLPWELTDENRRASLS